MHRPDSWHHFHDDSQRELHNHAGFISDQNFQNLGSSRIIPPEARSQGGVWLGAIDIHPYSDCLIVEYFSESRDERTSESITERFEKR